MRLADSAAFVFSFNSISTAEFCACRGTENNFCARLLHATDWGTGCSLVACMRCGSRCRQFQLNPRKYNKNKNIIIRKVKKDVVLLLLIESDKRQIPLRCFLLPLLHSLKDPDSITRQRLSHRGEENDILLL